MRTIKSNIPSLFQEGFTTVNVQFPMSNDTRVTGSSGRSYTYKVRLKDEIKKDEWIIVPTQSGPRCVQVTEVHEKPQLDKKDTIAYKWIIGRVETRVYDEIMKSEQEFMNTLDEIETRKIKNELVDHFTDGMSDEDKERFKQGLGKIDMGSIEQRLAIAAPAEKTESTTSGKTE